MNILSVIEDSEETIKNDFDIQNRFFMTIYSKLIFYNYHGDKMKVKLFDEIHEKDLEVAINTFLTTIDSDIIDIKYQVAIGISGEEQIYCFSAMVIYN